MQAYSVNHLTQNNQNVLLAFYQTRSFLMSHPRIKYGRSSHLCHGSYLAYTSSLFSPSHTFRAHFHYNVFVWKFNERNFQWKKWICWHKSCCRWTRIQSSVVYTVHLFYTSSGICIKSDTLPRLFCFIESAYSAFPWV